MDRRDVDVEKGSPRGGFKYPPLSGIMALGSNIFSAIGVITINKWLFVNEEFKYVLTLSLLHFIVTCGVLHVMLRLGYFEYKKLPIPPVAKLSATCTLAIMFMNLSLAQNTMGFYQLTKLLLIPMIVILQRTFYGKQFSSEILISLFILTFGIGLATVENVMVDSLGTIYALLAIFCHSWCQIFIGSLQKELNASPNLLVFYQMHMNCLFILPLIPFFDNLSFSDPASLWNFAWSTQSIIILLASCLTAGILNISGFFVIGIFSPVTYSVSGHAKTILVLVMGFWLFGDPLTPKVAVGILIAAFGLAGYGYFT